MKAFLRCSVFDFYYIYDARFLTLAENPETVAVTADEKLFKAPTEPQARLAHPLANVSSLVPDTG